MSYPEQDWIASGQENEQRSRLATVLRAYTQTALDIATDPATPQGEAMQAEYLWKKASQMNGEVFDLMGTEQLILTKKLSVAITQGSLAAHGITEDRLHVVMTKDYLGRQEFTLIDLGNIDLGNPHEIFDTCRSYDSIMADANDERFTYVIDGYSYDARSGMTSRVYDAKIDELERRGIRLPGLNESTILTGEPLIVVGVTKGYDAAHPDQHGRQMVRIRFGSYETSCLPSAEGDRLQFGLAITLPSEQLLAYRQSVDNI